MLFYKNKKKKNFHITKDNPNIWRKSLKLKHIKPTHFHTPVHCSTDAYGHAYAQKQTHTSR